MIRTTTAVVGAAAFIVALTLVLPSPASTPRQQPSTYQGKSAQAWHRIALFRLKQRDSARTRAGQAIRESRRLKRWVSVREPYSVSYAIKLAATAYGISERDMHIVASCESGHDPTASNGQYRGVFQEGPMFERGPFGQAGFSVWDPFANVFTAAYTVARGGWGQWSCKP